MQLDGKTKCSVCRAIHGTLPKRYVFVHEFDSALAVLAPSQYYRGRCELWLKVHHTELFQLPGTLREAFCHDAALLGKAMWNVFEPRKLNWEILGNTVPHLHCHIIPRYTWDPLPKRPIWENAQFKATERRYCARRIEKLAMAERLRAEIAMIERRRT